MSTDAVNSGSYFWFDRPAKNFNEAFPIGNGRLGAMVYGGNDTEVLSLNEDSLWSGLSAPVPKPTAIPALKRVRQLIFSGQHDQAEALIQKDMLSEFNQPYLPAGQLEIQWPDSMTVDQYQRKLSLDDGLVCVSTQEGQSSLRRDYFASGIDQMIAIQVRSEKQLLSKVLLSLSSKLKHRVVAHDKFLYLHGRIPTDVFWEDIEEAHTDSHQIFYDDEKSRYYTIGLTVVSQSGEVSIDQNGIVVTDAADFTVLIAIATGTDFNTPNSQCIKKLEQVVLQSPSELMQRHLADYHDYYQRMSLVFNGPNDAQKKTTEVRLSDYEQGRSDALLFSDLFNYARYLLISSSRPGTMPANLQGIWNEHVMPPWWSNYTININTEMNYWAAESCGLGDCHTALLDFVESLSIAGKHTAEHQYGCRGWVAHHQTDYRRQTTPVGFRKDTNFKQATKWAMWPMGGVWLSLHFYYHYQYDGDVQYLREKGYNVLKGAAEFLCDWLIDDPQNPSLLTTAPSTSPENSYRHPDGYVSSVCKGSAMDIAIARNLFVAFIEVSEVLSIPDETLLKEVNAKLHRLPEIKLTPDGRIMEFDSDWPEAEHPHRHISQLFSLAPGNDICPRDTPELAKAARKTLDFRTDAGTGWSTAWKSLCWLRLEQPERAFSLLNVLMKPLSTDIFGMADEGAGLYPNMLAACPPFQIDANFGFAAAVIEMLVQDHRGVIKLLPALPKDLANGHVKRLRLKGKLELSMSWKEGELIKVEILSGMKQKREFLIKNRLVEVNLDIDFPNDILSHFA